MNVCFLAALSLLSVASVWAQRPYTDEQVIAYAKAIDVKTLDGSLPSQRLEDWLQGGTVHGHVYSWRVADTCDLKPDGGEPDYPLCAKIAVGRNGEVGQFLVQVGTTHKGIVGSPQLYGEPGYEVGVEELDHVHTGAVGRLSELPGLLDRPPVTGGVSQLYQEIAAEHPIGIPRDATMAKIRPFLSQRLAEQLEAAHACEEDYFRQRHSPGAATPGWLKIDLFSGAGAHAAPLEPLPERKEPQADGSFLVYEELLMPRRAAQHPTRPYSANDWWWWWRVAVRVVPENGQYVVDDVRIFGSYSTNGPSYLLSESFSGCDGGRWTGVAVAKK
jgi:hypothetical protein